MARSAADCAVLLQAIAGADAKDPTARPEPTPDYLAEGARGVRGLTVGVDPAWNGDGVDAEVAAALATAVEAFRGLGCEVVEVRAPDVSAAVADWPDNCAVEAAVAHASTYPTRREDYGPVLAAVIEAGRALGGLDYQRILLRRAELKGRFAALLAGVDVLLTPAHPFAPVSLDTIRTLGEQPELIAGLQRYTCPFDMTGHPTLSLPAGFSAGGLPIGLQLVARDLGEDRLLRMGMAYQSATAWHRRRPALEGAQG
jgi:amidase